MGEGRIANLQKEVDTERCLLVSVAILVVASSSAHDYEWARQRRTANIVYKKAH
jgi:hypothetical protein